MTVSTILKTNQLIMSPPLLMPFRHRGGISKFAVRRWRNQPDRVTGYDEPGPGYHQGIDLIPGPDDVYGAVFSVAWGTITSIDEDDDGCQNVRIHHRHSPHGFVSQYFHIKDRGGRGVSSGIAVNQSVRPGELIGFICQKKAGPHLHFELRVETSPCGESVPVDPTPQLYAFEAERWPTRRDDSTYADWSMKKYAMITRLSIRPWEVQHEERPITWRTAHFLEVMFEDERPTNLPDREKAFYLPIEYGLDREARMVEVLRNAFTVGARVKLKGRDSLFFGERKMIEEVRVRPPKR